MPNTHLPKGWTLLDTKYLHRQPPWLTLRQDSLLLPNGHKLPKYFVLEYPNWVNTIAITKAGKMVMIRQYRYALDATHFELCAGVADASDNNPLESAKRELLEETGYGNGHWQLLLTTSANPATSNNLVYSYLATDVEQIAAPSPEETELLEIHLLDTEEVKQKMMDGSIVQATHLAPLWKYFSEMR